MTLNILCSPYADHCVQVTQCQGLPKLLTWPYAPDRAKRGTCGTQADYPYARDSSVGKHTDPNWDTSRIRTRFVPARRAVLLYAACTEKRKSTCWTWSNCAPPRFVVWVFVSAAARNQLAGMKRLSTRLEPYSLWLTSCQRTLLFVCQRPVCSK